MVNSQFGPNPALQLEILRRSGLSGGNRQQQQKPPQLFPNHGLNLNQPQQGQQFSGAELTGGLPGITAPQPDPPPQIQPVQQPMSLQGYNPGDGGAHQQMLMRRSLMGNGMMNQQMGTGIMAILRAIRGY